VHVNHLNCWVWSGNGTTSGDPGQITASVTPTLTPIPEVSGLFFILVNNSDRELCDLYFSADGTNWGVDNLEGSDRVAVNENRLYTFWDRWYFSEPGGYRVYYRVLGCSSTTPYEKTGVEELLYGGNLYINY
jgi:hypothetical protein